MAAGVQTWSQTAASNATADSNINFAEGMGPSALNDSCRSVMASVAKWRDDNNGTLVTSGTTTALTLVTNQVATANTTGYSVSFQFGTSASSGATLAVDGLAATPLQITPGTNLSGGEYLAGDRACFTYSSTGTGQWIAWPTPVLNVAGIAVLGPLSPAGTASGVGVMMGMGSTFVFTPTRSRHLHINMYMSGVNSSINGTCSATIYQGTGTAPTAGAALTGTIAASPLVGVSNPANVSQPMNITALTTLVPGTAYWFDLAIAATVGTASVARVNFVAHEV